MGIQKIKEIMPVPDTVIESENHEWDKLSHLLRTEFPTDYKCFLSLYGTGLIGDFLWIINPFSQNDNLNFSKAQYFREAYYALKDDFPEYYPRDKETFLPWGFTDNGDCLFWLVEDENPDAWLVGIQAADPSIEELTNVTMLEFIEQLITKQYKSEILPIEFLTLDKQFLVKR